MLCTQFSLFVLSTYLAYWVTAAALDCCARQPGVALPCAISAQTAITAPGQILHRVWRTVTFSRKRMTNLQQGATEWLKSPGLLRVYNGALERLNKEIELLIMDPILIVMKWLLAFGGWLQSFQQLVSRQVMAIASWLGYGLVAS